MAKSSKVEDYWREHNIENLFKELTQLLVRRVPPDPVIAIVEHLQKKFPKSFKKSSDNVGILSKSLANNLQMQSITSPHSDIQNESLSDIPNSRRLSSQSQISGIATIPTVGSAFTDFLKQDSNSTKLPPELNIKNLVFANRLVQQATKMGKDIRSDRDIIDEEIIKPIKPRLSIGNLSDNLVSEDLQNTETHEEPSVSQLIKYKQQIRKENDRGIHRAKLAELAQHRHKRELFFQSDQILKSDDHHVPLLQNQSGETKLSHKPMIKSKEEEEILKDENLFHPQKRRSRERLRNKLFSNTRGQYVLDLQSSMKRIDGNLICKLCGNIINLNDKQPIVYSQRDSAVPVISSFQPQISAQSVETTAGTVDDWFESASDDSTRQQSSPKAPDDVISPTIGSSTFRRNLFQAINDSNNDIVEHRPPSRTNDTTPKTKRSITPRMSETGVFSRSPESKIHRPSPAKKPPTGTTTISNPQLTKSSTERRMSSSSVVEHTPDDFDEN